MTCDIFKLLSCESILFLLIFNQIHLKLSCWFNSIILHSIINKFSLNHQFLKFRNCWFLLLISLITWLPIWIFLSINRLPYFIKSKASFSHFLQKHLSNSKVSQAYFSKSKFLSECLTIFDRIDLINISKLNLWKRYFSLFIAHPNYLIVINFKVIRKR